MNDVVVVKSLAFGYPKKDVMEDFSISLKQAQLTCLLGENGAGKSTLINLILGRLTSQQGSIELFGKIQDVNLVKKRIGVMLQNSTAPEKATVAELVKLFSSYYPSPLDWQLLIRDLGLEVIQHQRFGELSGGQKQLVLLALALCGDPDLLFLDEPSVGMDIEVRRKLWSIIEQLKAQGKTIVLTTHYLEEAEALADRIVVLQQGKIIADDSPEKIKQRFNKKQIKAKTRQSLEWLNQLPDVSAVMSVGQYVEVISDNSEASLKQWLATDESISDLTVTHAGLEQAFLKLTQVEA